MAPQPFKTVCEAVSWFFQSFYPFSFVMFSAALSPMGVASCRPPQLSTTSSASPQAMGATDVLPYPRRRSSVQLEPLECRLMSSSERESTSPPTKSRTISSGTDEDVLPGTVLSSSHPSLNPVRVNGHRKVGNTLSDDTRCNSCENPRRGRSQSLHHGRLTRPGESRRRLQSDDADEDETTAEFIEKLRKELISQLNHI